MKRLCLLFALTFLFLLVGSVPNGVKAQERTVKVVLISIDGLRPDALMQAGTPVISALMKKGYFTLLAQSANPPYTLVGHATMLSGMNPEKHGLNQSQPCIGCRIYMSETVFSVAHYFGLTTAAVVGKHKFDYILSVGGLDRVFLPTAEEDCDVHDERIKAEAVKIIREDMPDLMFIHFPDTDRVGHDYGWMSTNQFYSINFVDRQIGEILTAIWEVGYLDETVIIITGDHGGHGFGHGLDTPEDRTIPWIIVGPGTPNGVMITDLVQTVDTSPTILNILGLPIPDYWDGRVIPGVFSFD